MSLSAWYRHQKKFKDCPKAKDEMKLLRGRIQIEYAQLILAEKLGEDGTDAPEPDHPSAAGYIQRGNTA